MVAFPKTKKTYCPSDKCHKHTVHKISQYKKGKDNQHAQGTRRYHRKQQGFGGQPKPIFHKKAKVTKKIVIRLECTECGYRTQQKLKRAKHFEVGVEKKAKKGDLVTY